MVTRRRYAKPQGFRDGGRVPLKGASADADVTSSPPPSIADAIPEAVPPPVEPISTPEADGALARILAESRRADEMQRQAAEQAAQREQEIAAMPVSDFKKDTLRIVPKDLWPLLGQHWHAALSEGVRDDSPQMRLRINGQENQDDGRRASGPARRRFRRRGR